jgi:2-iminobutanoate/2-iminopropanoate deaminase
MTTPEPLRAAVTVTPLGRPDILSPAFIADGCFVHVSGQGPLADGAYVPGTIQEETRRTLDNVATVLEASGSSLRHVVRCGVYLTDLADFDGMNEVWSDYFEPDRRPARTTIQAAALPGGIRVEIDCVAVLAGEWRQRLTSAPSADVLDFAAIRGASA